MALFIIINRNKSITVPNTVYFLWMLKCVGSIDVEWFLKKLNLKENNANGIAIQSTLTVNIGDSGGEIKRIQNRAFAW